MEQFIEAINKAACERMNRVGVSEFTLLLTKRHPNLRDLLACSSSIYKDLEKHLNRERRIEFLLFIKTINAKILEEVRTVVLKE